jgi:ketosteroid isomerase-like protein
VFIRENMPAAIGTEALRAAYRQIFATLKVDLHFDTQQSEASGSLAWVRTTSNGRIRTLATGREADEAYNGLFVLGREGTTWKIRCYLYASSKA